MHRIVLKAIGFVLVTGSLLSAQAAGLGLGISGSSHASINTPKLLNAGEITAPSTNSTSTDASNSTEENGGKDSVSGNNQTNTNGSLKSHSTKALSVQSSTSTSVQEQ